MAEGSSPSSAAAAPASSSLKGLREQMVAAAQALADERRNQSGMSASPVPSAITIKSATKPVIDGSILKSEERQRLARERREEREKLNAVKELQILDKERKAKLQYEKQMEEKQRRLREQKLKEQQRRAAVEEKRKQKIVEEKEHYEAVVHRTLERSQRLDTRQKRWSWGGSVTDSDSKTEPPSTAEASKRSTSTANLKQAETVINKRLSSSAALLNSPSKSTTKRSASLNRLNNKAPVNSEQPVPKGVQVEQKGGVEKKRSSSLSRMSNKLQSSELENVQNEEKTARRPQLIPLDSNVISRLLAPTQASLARSKSAASLSADGKDPSESPLCPRSASNSAISSPVHVPKVPVRSRSIDRLKASDPSENVSLESAQKTEGAKSAAGRRAPSPSLSTPRRSPSPANVGKHPSSPAARQKSHPPSPSVLRQRPPSPARVPKPAPIQRPSLTPNVLSITKKKTDTESKPKERAEEAGGKEPGPSSQTSERENAANASKTKEESPTPFTPLPDLPPSIFAPSYRTGAPYWSPDLQYLSSAARKIVLEFNPMSVAGASSHTHSGSSPPSYSDPGGSTHFPHPPPPHFAGGPQNVGNRRPLKRPRNGFPPNFTVEATRQGDGMGSPFRCFGLPCTPPRGGSGYSLGSHSSLGGRLPASGMTDPFILEKLLHTFQTMRSSVDNISQELRVLNSHLASLSRHFSTAPYPGRYPPPEQNGPDGYFSRDAPYFRI
ncbi:MAP7 domain-containing protein 3 isoform X10 [Hemicordylus capensis]|uniref:MAP7 domain-containing protein 3 isoform X10 n=1 Tax=Hemicordylus capensis TaxID=884348 RepID=UPI002303839B|nr:MAP7 domain-containing protein 3 isoform X10 [Hemicordylus capensis]